MIGPGSNKKKRLYCLDAGRWCGDNLRVIERRRKIACLVSPRLLLCDATSENTEIMTRLQLTIHILDCGHYSQSRVMWQGAFLRKGYQAFFAWTFKENLKIILCRMDPMNNHKTSKLKEWKCAWYFQSGVKMMAKKARLSLLVAFVISLPSASAFLGGNVQRWNLSMPSLPAAV